MFSASTAINIALLTEGGWLGIGGYKHSPPGGGRVFSASTSINIALLAEGARLMGENL